MTFLICFVLLPYAFLLSLSQILHTILLALLRVPLVYIFGYFCQVYGHLNDSPNLSPFAGFPSPLLEVGLYLFGLIKSLAVHIIFSYGKNGISYNTDQNYHKITLYFKSTSALYIYIKRHKILTWIWALFCQGIYKFVNFTEAMLHPHLGNLVDESYAIHNKRNMV